MRILALLGALSLGCAAVPTPESLRPRGVNFYVEHGTGDYGPEKLTDFRVGVSVQFDLVYPDEE